MKRLLKSLDPRSRPQEILCPTFDPAKPLPRSWGCKSTFMDRHVCSGHANSRPDYMHRCGCGRRWAA